MNAFAAGILFALGLALAFAVLAGAARLAFHRRLRRLRAGGPVPLGRLFRRLGTRPEQEAVIGVEADALAEELRRLRDDGRALRGELADLLAGPTLDAEAARRAVAGRVARLDAVGARLAQALARTHAALDEAQRARLAALLRCGPGGRWHGPGRRGVAA